MTARLKGRRRRAAAVTDAVARWAREQADVSALGLVGSYAYDRPTMASDVDLVLVTSNTDRLPAALTGSPPSVPGRG